MADQNIIKAIAKWGKDKLGNIIAYKTLTRCVFDDNGNRLSDILASGGTGTAALMTNEDAGVGRPDGTTIEVKENGIFGLVHDNINVDDTLSNTSTNPVQNKIVTNAINECAKKTQIPTIIDLSDKLKNGRYNDYSLNDDFSKCYKINNIIYGQLFITGLKDEEKANQRILVAAFDEDYFQNRTSDASFFCGYLEMLESNGNIYWSDKNNRIQIPLVYDPINYEIEAISLEDDTLHFQSTAILSGYFRLIT